MNNLKSNNDSNNLDFNSNSKSNNDSNNLDSNSNSKSNNDYDNLKSNNDSNNLDSNSNNLNWSEKYRPTDLDNIVMSSESKNIIKLWIKDFKKKKKKY